MKRACLASNLSSPPPLFSDRMGTKHSEAALKSIGSELRAEPPKPIHLTVNRSESQRLWEAGAWPQVDPRVRPGDHRMKGGMWKSLKFMVRPTELALRAGDLRVRKTAVTPSPQLTQAHVTALRPTSPILC